MRRQLNVLVPPRVLAEVKRIARKDKCSRADIVIAALERYFLGRHFEGSYVIERDNDSEEEQSVK